MNWDDDFVCHTTINSCATFENVQTQKRRKKLSIAKLSFQKRFFLASSRKKKLNWGKNFASSIAENLAYDNRKLSSIMYSRKFCYISMSRFFFSSWRHTMKKEYFASSHCRNGSHKTYKIENFKTSLFFCWTSKQKKIWLWAENRRKNRSKL